jgi:hypothetical protein
MPGARVVHRAPTAPPRRAPLVLLLLFPVACTPHSGPEFRLGGSDVDTGIPDGEHDPLSWLHDYWTPSAEACPLPEDFDGKMTVGDFYDDPCLDALAADLKLDVESFSSQPGGERAWLRLFHAAFYLRMRDTGTVASLLDLDDEQRYAIRGPFIAQVQAIAETQDEDELRPILYDMVMSTIQRTVYNPENKHAATIDIETRTLKWDLGGTTPDGGASTLAHEAAHAWLNIGHIPCPEGTICGSTGEHDYSGKRSCDADWAGAYGFQIAVYRLFYDGEQVVDPGGNSSMLDNIEWAACFIVED